MQNTASFLVRRIRPGVCGLIVLGLSLRAAAQGAGPAVVAGPVTNPANGHRYLLLEPSSWEAAEARAVELGGHLVTVDDAAENLWVRGTFGPATTGPRPLWIGLRDTHRVPTVGWTPAQRMAQFAWADGSNPAYSNWWAGRPNNAGPQGDGTGTQFWAYLRPDLLWDDVDNNLGGIQGVVEVVPTVPARNRIVAWGPGLTAALVPPDSTRGAVAVGAGIGFGVALKPDGGLVVWPPTGPQPPAGLGPVAQVAVGSEHVVALLRDGTVRAWGGNGSGQAVPPAGIAGAVAVAAGYFHSLAVDASGKLWTWGSAPSGAPSQAQLAGTWTLSAGFDEDYALKVDGSLLVWGTGPGAKQKPAVLPPLAGIRGGHVQAVARGLDGKAFGWGGFDNPARFAPPASLGQSPVAVVSASLYEPFDVAVRADDFRVVQWGDTGNGDPLPFPPRLSGILDLALGGNVAFALLAPPAGDDFAQAVKLGGSQLGLTVQGDTKDATVETGEPSPYGERGGGDSLWYTWTPTNYRNLLEVQMLSSGKQFSVYRAGSRSDPWGSLIRVVNGLTDAQGRNFPASLVATAGEPLYIRVESVPDPFGGGIQPGPFSMRVNSWYGVENDLFALSRPLVPTLSRPVEGSLLAATQEFGEQTFPSGTGSVWWHWTADAAPAGTTLRATVAATGNQPLLQLRIVQGSGDAHWADVPGVDYSTAGLTRIAAWDAVPGQRYEIAVGGSPFDNFGAVENRVFTQIRLDFSASPVAIRQAQVTVTQKADRSATLQGSLVVANQSKGPTGRLRLRLYQRPGYALNNSQDKPSGDLSLATFVKEVPVSDGLAAGVVATVPVDMALPSSDGQLFFGEQGTGWGGYAVLEELAATRSATPRWRALDRRLLGTGPWPFYDLSNVGPGGGAIRIDPGAGAPPLDLVELSAVDVGGPDTLAGGAAAAFTASAKWTDGASEPVDADWSVDAPAKISPAGVLDTASVAQTTDLQVRAAYASGGMRVVGARRVRVTVTPFRWGPPAVAGGGVALRLGAKPGQRVRIEASSDLRAWSPAGEFTVPASGTLDVPVTPSPGNTSQFLRALAIP